MKNLFLLLILFLESVSFGQTVELRTTIDVPPATFVKQRMRWNGVNTPYNAWWYSTPAPYFRLVDRTGSNVQTVESEPSFSDYKLILSYLTGVPVGSITSGTVYPVTNLSLFNNLNMNGYYLCHDATIGYKIFLFTTPLSSESFTPNSLSIYPNPTKDLFHIDLQNELSGKITDLTGKTLMNVNTKDIDVSSLSAGIYLLDIISEEKHYVSKIIKE